MAELLIRNTDSWLQSLTQKEIDDRGLQEKYDSRKEKGDIVEVREDGYWSVKHGWNKNAFALVKLPGVEVEDVKHLTEPIYKEIDEFNEIGLKKRVMVKRRKYKTDIDFSMVKDVTKNSVNDLQLVDKSII